MSRAFVKEDDSGEPPIISPRAALPPNMPNYATPLGLELLRAELTALEQERSLVESNRENEADRTRQLTILNAQLKALTARIASAKVVNLANQPVNEVRFGATVLLKTISGGKHKTERRLTIVGVDEASVTQGKIAFVSPIARAITGAHLGDQVLLRLGREEETVEIAAINYETEVEK